MAQSEKAGSNLEYQAKQYTGSVKKWKELYEANKKTVGANPDVIQPGMELVLPWDETVRCKTKPPRISRRVFY